MFSESRSQQSDARLGRDVQAKIGQQLRAMYDDVVNQGVPDRFVELLDRLDQADAAKPGGHSGGTDGSSDSKDGQ